MNNKEKDFAPSSWAVNNSTTMYVVMAIVLFLGIDAYFSMPREDYPEIKENIVFVSSIYPGNTSEDLEKLITEPLEDKLKSVNNIIDIKFEELLSDPDNTINRLLDFCDLERNDDYINFHKSNSLLIKTASANQARKPIQKENVFKYQKFRDYFDFN